MSKNDGCKHELKLSWLTGNGTGHVFRHFVPGCLKAWCIVLLGAKHVKINPQVAFLAFPSHPSSTSMCRSLTFVIEYACRHRYPKDTQKVDCRKSNCRLSKLHSTHPQLQCAQTCKQG